MCQLKKKQTNEQTEHAGVDMASLLSLLQRLMLFQPEHQSMLEFSHTKEGRRLQHISVHGSHPGAVRRE